jgi:RecA-family ATPase
MLYGDGGIGKTTAAVQMGVAVAAGVPIFGRSTIRTPVLFVLAEDDYAVTKTRILAQCTSFKVKLEDLPITIWCLPGHDISLAKVEDNGAASKRPFYDALAARLRAAPGTFVVLDSLADIAQMGEKDRAPANTFLKKVLGNFCTKLGATILVLGHPSKASMADGSYHSGTTAFRNAVRNMLVMKPVKDQKTARTLEVHKSNYGPAIDIALWWIGGIFMMLDNEEVKKDAAVKSDIVMEKVFSLIDSGCQVTRTNRSNGYTPARVAKLVNADGVVVVTDEVVKDILFAAEASKAVRYQPRKGSVEARYFRVNPAEDFANAPVDDLMQPLAPVEPWE